MPFQAATRSSLASCLDGLSAASAALISRKADVKPSIPSHVSFPLGENGCSRPAAVPEAPPPRPWTSYTVIWTDADCGAVSCMNTFTRLESFGQNAGVSQFVQPIICRWSLFVQRAWLGEYQQVKGSCHTSKACSNDYIFLAFTRRTNRGSFERSPITELALPTRTCVCKNTTY